MRGVDAVHVGDRVEEDLESASLRLPRDGHGHREARERVANRLFGVELLRADLVAALSNARALSRLRSASCGSSVVEARREDRIEGPDLLRSPSAPSASTSGGDRLVERARAARRGVANGVDDGVSVTPPSALPSWRVM